MDAGDWNKAAQFIDICDSIWYNSPELTGIRETIAVNLNARMFESSEERERARAALVRDWRDDGTRTRFAQSGFALYENQDQVDATEAITMSITAFNEARYFEAHWLANLGARLAPGGSAQQTNALRLASEAWNMISLQAPSQREIRLYQLHNMSKRLSHESLL